jgi:hypothetical protein
MLISILSPPLRAIAAGSPGERATDLLELSNLWLGPIQHRVIVCVGVLFFLKENDKAPAGQIRQARQFHSADAGVVGQSVQASATSEKGQCLPFGIGQECARS